MKEDEIFQSWGDLDDGKESVWSADWAIDLDQPKSEVTVTVGYNNQEEFIWSYTDIDKAFNEGTVGAFLSKYISGPIPKEDIKEITDFFFHWLQIVDAGGTLEMDVSDEDLIEIDIDEH